jgi:hypothetical protein
MLAGNVAALLSPFLYVPILTYAFGAENYDYESMKSIRLGDDAVPSGHGDPELVNAPAASNPSPSAFKDHPDQVKLLKASRIAKITTATMTLILLVLWPMPLYGTGYVFSKKFFTGWVVVGILWLFCSLFCVGIYPLFEGRKTLAHVSKSIVLDLTGRRKPVLQGRQGVGSESEEASVQQEKPGELKS